MKTESRRQQRITAGILVPTALLISGIFLGGCKSPNLPVGPPLDRVTAWNANPRHSYGQEDALLKWLEAKTPSTIVHTPEDLRLNELARCMSPFTVNWAESDVSGSDHEFVLVHGVQVAGNPILGTSRHATIRIPEHGIERIEFVIVRYHLRGPARTGGHVQLRFVFKQDCRPQLFDDDGNPDPMQPYLDDLIMSWEAWRPTNTPWEFVKGLDPEQYSLTARLYSGNQRFLNDALRGAVWDCYPLQLPDDEDATDMILWGGLIMGDSLARKTIAAVMQDRLKIAPGENLPIKWRKEQQIKLRKRVAWDEIPDDWFKDLMQEADTSYHALERSCISTSLFQIESAMERLYNEKNLGPRKKVDFIPSGNIPAWFSDVVSDPDSKHRLGALRAFFWTEANKEVLPYKAYLPLKRAGLLQTDKKGKLIRYRYGHKLGSPYGALGRNLM
jgi:hypothetical protein